MAHMCAIVGRVRGVGRMVFCELGILTTMVGNGMYVDSCI